MIKQFFTFLLVVGFAFTSVAQVYETPEKAKPLKIGEKIPDVSVQSLDGSEQKFQAVVANKPAVVLFYRGGWCPYCNKHLAAVGETKDEINDLGYQIIGISPDAPAKLNETMEKGDLGYKLYSDSDTKLIQAMGIAYLAPDRYNSTLSSFSNNQNENTIPVPSLYVVDTDGQIIFQYSDVNYKERISTKKLLKELKKL